MRPGIVHATHQCAQFSEGPRVPHGSAVENLAKYLAATKNNRLILDPENTKSLEVFTILRKISQSYSSWRRHHHEITYMLSYYACRLPTHIGFQAKKSDSTNLRLFWFNLTDQSYLRIWLKSCYRFKPYSHGGHKFSLRLHLGGLLQSTHDFSFTDIQCKGKESLAAAQQKAEIIQYVR